MPISSRATFLTIFSTRHSMSDMAHEDWITLKERRIALRAGWVSSLSRKAALAEAKAHASGCYFLGGGGGGGGGLTAFAGIGETPRAGTSPPPGGTFGTDGLFVMLHSVSCSPEGIGRNSIISTSDADTNIWETPSSGSRLFSSFSHSHLIIRKCWSSTRLGHS